MFVKRLDQLVNEKGIKRSKFLSDLKLNKNSFINWEKRKNIPDGITLYEIAKYFDVSMEYLIGATNEHRSQLSEEEKRLLAAYREQSEEGKKIIRRSLGLEEPAIRAVDSDPTSELGTDMKNAFTVTTT